MAEEVEHIPDGDQVSRHIDYPHKYDDSRDLLWGMAFMFPNGDGESLIWRKYKPLIDDVHALGCERQMVKQQTSPRWRYVGAITATAGRLRGAKSVRGHGFVVEHHPEDDQGEYHAEVHRRQGDVPMTKNERAELRYMLAKIFEPLEPCTCP